MAAAAVYSPSVYDSLPSLHAASDTFEQLHELFLKHEVYNELAICLLHRHFDLSPSEKLVELGAISSPWEDSQNRPNVFGGSIVPRSWAFRQGSLFPFEFGYNEGLKAEVYKPLPEKPAFYTELNDLLVKHGLEHLLGLTLNTDEIRSGTVKFEKTFDRSNVVFTIKYDNEIAAKEAIPAM
ncbi:uncharacterized protein TrAFT101_008151 [Trichoderma asperellum]|uniref:uncharacterized protein n=1 Tax=Trichoderma asperellum TaxID=101201 RepID=UPI003323C645|nr:hypothetical protein TrAFT101_008151 [Trichoderma asperellum]